RLTVAEAEELFKVRELLEGLVAREAALNMSRSVADDLEGKLRLMQAAADTEQYADMVRAASDFHQLLYAPSRNETAVRFLEQLRRRIERYRRIGGYKHPRYAACQPVEEHQRILSRMREGDADGAEQAMRLHIR